MVHSQTFLRATGCCEKPQVFCSCAWKFISYSSGSSLQWGCSFRNPGHRFSAMVTVWQLPKLPWTLALGWQMGDERALKTGWEVCMSRAGKGIFHPHPTGQTSVTTSHPPARGAGHLSSCVPGWRGKRPGKHHGVPATASSNLPNPRVHSAQGYWLCRLPEESGGHGHGKAHLPLWSTWWKWLTSHLQILKTEIVLSFPFSSETESFHCSLRTLSVGTGTWPIWGGDWHDHSWLLKGSSADGAGFACSAWGMLQGTYNYRISESLYLAPWFPVQQRLRGLPKPSAHSLMPGSTSFKQWMTDFLF